MTSTEAERLQFCMTQAIALIQRLEHANRIQTGAIRELHGRVTTQAEEIVGMRRELEMSDGCQSMIRDDLEALGKDTSRTPPMMYNDAMRATMGRLVKEATEKAEAERDALLEGMREIAEDAGSHTVSTNHPQTSGFGNIFAIATRHLEGREK